MLREASNSIFYQYLSEKASPRVKCEEKLLKKIWSHIQNRDPSDAVFDEIQARVWHMMQEDVRYFPAFVKSQLYLRLLAELDLSGGEQAPNDVTDEAVVDVSTQCLTFEDNPEDLFESDTGSQDIVAPSSDDESSKTSLDSLTISYSAKSAKLDIKEARSSPKHSASEGGSLRSSPRIVRKNIEDIKADTYRPRSNSDTLKRDDVIKGGDVTKVKSDGGCVGGGEKSDRRPEYSLSAQISNTGLCREHGKQYAVYLVCVNKRSATQPDTTWSVYRRYSDFHDLHSIIQQQFTALAAGLVLPSKKAFNNMTKALIERRKNGLNAYIQTVLTPGVLSCHKGLLDLMHSFFEPRGWQQTKSGGKKREPVSGIRSVGQLVRSVPDTLADGVTTIKNLPGSVVDGMSKILTTKTVTGVPGSGVITPLELPESQKVGASLVNDEEENIPLRIMLLLMDEVFDLRARQQWLRRRIVAILRQFIKTMFGDSINRKIVDYVERQTAAEQIAEHLKLFKDNQWPNGKLAETLPPRDQGTRMRNRVVTKAKMLGTIDDELKSFLGSDTTRRGVTRVFNMFQQRALNKRLVYVILEGMLTTLFPDHKFPEVFHKIHSGSPTAKQAAGKTAAGKEVQR